MPDMALINKTDKSDVVDARDFKLDEEKLAIEWCKDISDQYEEMQNTVHKEWNKWLEDARDIKPTKNKPFIGSANFSVNVTSTAIDSIVPREVEEIFGYNEPISMKPLFYSEENLFYQKWANKIMKWDIESHYDLKNEIWHGIENVNIYGTAFFYTYWDEQKEWIDEEIQVINLPNGQQMPYAPHYITALQQQGLPFEVTTVINKKLILKKYEPKTICLDNKSVCWNYDAESLDDAFKTGFVAIKIEKTLDEIWRSIKGFSEEEGKLYSKIKDVATKEKLKQLLDTGVNDPTEDLKKLTKLNAWKTKKIPLWLRFSKYDIDGDELDEYVVALLHLPSKTMLGYEKYAFEHGECPVVEAQIHPIHKKVLGIGIAEKCYSEKGYLDALRNQMCDNRTLHNAPIRKYTKESGYNPTIHKISITGTNWLLNSLSEEAMRTEQVVPYHTDHWKEFSELKNEIDQRFGMSEISRGNVPTQETTFRGMMMLLEEGSKTRSMWKKWIAQSLQKVFTQRWNLYCQYWGRQAQKEPEVQQWIQQIMDSENSVFTPESVTALDKKFNLLLKATYDEKKIKLIEEKDKFEFLAPYLADKPQYLRKAIIKLLNAMDDDDPESRFPTQEEIFKEQVAIQKEAMRQLQMEQAIQAQKEAEQKAKEAEIAAQQQEQMEFENEAEAEKNKTLGKMEVIGTLEEINKQRKENLKNG